VTTCESKSLLPFRAIRDGTRLFVECDNSEHHPYRLPADDAIYQPAGHEVHKLMTMYRELEAISEATAKERDELRDKAAELEGQLAHANKRIQGFEDQKKQERKWVCACGRKNHGETCGSCQAPRGDA
jgi:hypothetical protein